MLYMLAVVGRPSLHGHDACMAYWANGALRRICRRTEYKTSFSPFRVFLFSRKFWGKVLGSGILAFMDWEGSASWAFLYFHHLGIEVLNVGCWLTHGDLALDTSVDFLAVVEHRLIPARVRSEWSRLKEEGSLHPTGGRPAGMGRRAQCAKVRGERTEAGCVDSCGNDAFLSCRVESPSSRVARVTSALHNLCLAHSPSIPAHNSHARMPHARCVVNSVGEKAYGRRLSCVPGGTKSLSTSTRRGVSVLLCMSPLIHSRRL